MDKAIESPAIKPLRAYTDTVAALETAATPAAEGQLGRGLSVDGHGHAIPPPGTSQLVIGQVLLVRIFHVKNIHTRTTYMHLL